MRPPAGHEWDQVRTHIHVHLKTLFDIEDSSGIALFVLLQRVARLSMLFDAQLGDDTELSAPRWRLLLRLLIEEELGNSAGITPTALSRSQHVNKNTISALLRGLEAQGLIQRALDAADRRVFRIQLTQAGRDCLFSTAPRRIEGFNRLLSGLDPQEREQLTTLLEKVQSSLTEQNHNLQTDPDADKTRPGSLDQE